MRVKHLFRIEVLAVLLVISGAIGYSFYRQSNPSSPQVPARQATPSIEIGDAVARAIELSGQDKAGEALSVLDGVKDKPANDQDKYQLYSAYGTVYMRQKDYVRAYDAYREVIAVKPADAAAQFNYGLSAQRTADYTAAVAAFEQVQKLKNDQTPAHMLQRSSAGIPASKARQEELKAYDAGLVRALGRYTWYEVTDNEDGMVRVYPQVVDVVTGNKIDQKVVDELRTKLQQIIFADQAI